MQFDVVINCEKTVVFKIINIGEFHKFFMRKMKPRKLVDETVPSSPCHSIEIQYSVLLINLATSL